LGVSACSVPFNYEVNVLNYADLSGAFTVGQGGISPNPKTVGPVEIRYTPDPRVNLTGVSLDYKVCFTSETPGASFQGNVVYTAYLGGDAGTLFQEANKLAEGTKDVSGLSTGAVCVEGQAQATAAQVQAFAERHLLRGGQDLRECYQRPGGHGALQRGAVPLEAFGDGEALAPSWG
jgi:hypothetical protein